MKLKVEKKFRDKITGELHNVNDEIEVAEARGKELLADSRNLVTQVKEAAKKPKATTKAKGKSKKSEN